jgi:hypothetical protein
MRTQIARGSQSPSSTADTYRPATPQDLASWGIPAGTAVKINNRTGEPQVISGAKPASEYTPTQQSKFIQQAQTLDSVDGALKAYTDLIDAAGPQLWTTGIGGDNPKAKQLDAARTAILIQAKELFNLGVLAAFVMSTSFGLLWADGLIAIVIAVVVMWSTRSIGIRAFNNLMDREMPDAEKARLQQVVEATEGIRGYHKLKTRYAGTRAFIQMHVDIDANLNFREAHAITDALEHALEAAFPDTEVIIHPDPHER